MVLLFLDYLTAIQSDGHKDVQLDELEEETLSSEPTNQPKQSKIQRLLSKFNMKPNPDEKLVKRMREGYYQLTYTRLCLFSKFESPIYRHYVHNNKLSIIFGKVSYEGAAQNPNTRDNPN